MGKRPYDGWIRVNGIGFKWVYHDNMFFSFGVSSITVSGLYTKIKRMLDAQGINLKEIERRVQK